MESEYGKITGSLRTRTGKGGARKLRHTGKIPAVLYGEGGPSEMLSIDPKEMLRAVDPAKGRNTVFTLTLEGGDKTIQQKVMLKDYQRDTLKDHWLHADFIRVTDETKVHVEIPFILEGTAIGVKEGGKVSQVFHTLPVVCATKLIPSSLTVDITEMGVGAALSVKDLSIPEGVEISLPQEQTICTVLLPRGLKEEEGNHLTEGEEEGEEGGEEAAAG